MPIPVAFFFGGAPGGHEMIFVLLAILLLFGAKRLPEIARSLGRSMEEFRRAARDVTDEIMNADKVQPKEPEPLPAGESEPLPPSRSYEDEDGLGDPSPEPEPPYGISDSAPPYGPIDEEEAELGEPAQPPELQQDEDKADAGPV